MRKIHSSIDDKFDNLYINIAEFVSPFFYKLNYTPNDITTLNIISLLISVYCLLNYNYIYGSIFYLLGYFFDVLDGYYARKYKMETAFGDKYDHYTDYSFYIIITYILFFNSQIKYKFIFICGYILLSLTASIHLGCTEHFNNNKSHSNKQLSNLQFICPYPKFINIIKYVGPGTFTTYTFIFLLFFGINK
tara:strand:- start:2090 stop:2662 length:573 start_codon:yes stop_codon:yes gene_type:complete